MTRLIALNKPWGVLCQFRRNDDRPTLADYIDLPGVYPAGRLDRDSEGLLLLTDDGTLQHRIASPVAKLPKTYWVQVEREPDDDALDALRKGVLLDGRATLRAEVQRQAEPGSLWPREPPIRHRLNVPTAWLAITLREGRNRQVRRMTAAVGHPTLRLVRARIGQLSLGELEPGAWREVLPAELGLATARFEPSRTAGKTSRTNRPDWGRSERRRPQPGPGRSGPGRRRR